MPEGARRRLKALDVGTNYLAGSAFLLVFPPLVARQIPPLSVVAMLSVRFLIQYAFFLIWSRSLRKPEGFRSAGSVAAGLAFAFYTALYFTSLELTLASSAIVLSSLAPVMLLTRDIALTRRIRWTHALSTLLATLAVASFWSATGFNLGDGIALASSVFYAIYIVASERVLQDRNWETAIFHQTYVSLSATLVLGAALLAVQHRSISTAQALEGSWVPALLTAAIAVAGHALFSQAQRSVSALTVGIAGVATTVTAGLLAALIFDSSNLAPALAGTVLATLALLNLIWTKLPNRRKPE